MIRETSRIAYEDIPLTERQNSVFQAIHELGECTDQEIADKLHWPICCVPGRRGELVKAGLVTKSGRKTNANGNPCITWKLSAPHSPAYRTEQNRQMGMFG